MKADGRGEDYVPHTPTVHLLQDSEISFPKRDVSTLSKLKSIMTKAFALCNLEIWIEKISIYVIFPLANDNIELSILKVRQAHKTLNLCNFKIFINKIVQHL